MKHSTPDHPHHTHPWSRALCRVTYRMTDMMGIVYYGNYMEFFEIGRNEMMRTTGLNYLEMEAAGYMLAVTHTSCDYLTPARFDDLLEISARVVTMTRARIHFGYEIRRSGEETLIARGTTQHAYLSPEGRPRRLAPDWWEKLQVLAPPPDAD